MSKMTDARRRYDSHVATCGPCNGYGPDKSNSGLCDKGNQLWRNYLLARQRKD